jgi:O-antigen/teichoic acid export membrane protein
VVFLLPIHAWLGLKTDAFTASATVYLLGLQILIRMLFGFLAGMFLVIGVAYRGGYWNNMLAVAFTAGTAGMLFLNASFTWIAAQQLITIGLFCLFVLIDIRVNAPAIFPRMSYVRRSRIREILKPSGYFGLLFSSNFLVYQLPVMLLQRILGPATVVVFSLTRTIFSMSRQVLVIPSQSMGPEITELYGKLNWNQLFRLYELSERVIFALVAPISIGTMLATPLLMTIWLHKPSLYDPYVCLFMTLISGVIGIKDHKYNFQTWSNQHTRLAKLAVWGYLTMVALAVPAIHLFGVLGFLAVWLATEVVLLLAILRLNERLFAGVTRLNFTPVYKLLALMGGATMVSAWLALSTAQKSLSAIAFTTVVSVTVLLVISYPLFGIKEVRSYLRGRTAVAGGKSG